MKKLVFLLAFVCVSMLGFAQTQMAVLQRNDTIKNIYYGSGAFVSAYNAAADGDIIILSSGSFNSCDIGKAVTIRGAGARVEEGRQPTVLVGNYNGIHPTTSTVHVEGVNLNTDVYLITGSNAEFTRCIMKGLRCYNKKITSNLNVYNCLIVVNDISFCSNSIINIINSVCYGSRVLDNCTVCNSYINFGYGYSVAPNNINSSFVNCIFSYGLGAPQGISLQPSNIMSNCVAINMQGLFDNNNGGIGTNTYRSAMSDVFETFAGGTMNYYEEYILKEDFATGFPGSDGTEVGIHGGMMPFSLDPSYMIVKSCNVASRSTIDGKLSVDIEIETEE